MRVIVPFLVLPLRRPLVLTPVHKHIILSTIGEILKRDETIEREREERERTDHTNETNRERDSEINYPARDKLLTELNSFQFLY